MLLRLAAGTSTSVHPALEDAYTTEAAVSDLCNLEGAAALAPFAANRILLGHKDADPPYRPYSQDRLEQITDELRAVVDAHPDAELLAPAAVTRHPDHLLVHEAAARLGCRWFWEDLAFWSTYALAGCDQHLFRARTGPTLTTELVDITDVVLDKNRPAGRRGRAVQLGGALGVAVIGSLLTTRYQDRMAPPLAPYHLPRILSDSVLGSLGGALELAQRVGGTSGRLLAALARSAFVSGISLGLTVGAAVGAGGAALAFAALPSRPPTDTPTSVNPSNPEGE
ncbi:hypothetical protein ACIRVK_39270 [Streptomyces sp. NPDC101152]|uniref:hypothetical protein n=1 Tax=Streptomyces sp. NPDC101152 TaxID=3366116 RepID=UPI003829AB5F